MATKKTLAGTSVYTKAVERLEALYLDGHRVVVGFSGGKDSTVVLECALIAAGQTGAGPVEAFCRDEELGYPGHYKYVERTANRLHVDLKWIVASEPHSNAYDREQPFWWAFDRQKMSDIYVRQPPAGFTEIDEITIEAIAPKFYQQPDRQTFVAVGLRASESITRRLGVFSMKGHLTQPNEFGTRYIWPIYDWAESDVWRAIFENHWDYATAYDHLLRSGAPRNMLRMGAMMNRFAAASLPVAERIWPAWADQVKARIPRSFLGFKLGEAAVKPPHRESELWRTTFSRECIERAPLWIAERSETVRSRVLSKHRRHSTATYPEQEPCQQCGPSKGSWKQLTEGMYLGDPFSEFTASGLPYMQPAYFRPELAGTTAGEWGGHPG